MRKAIICDIDQCLLDSTIPIMMKETAKSTLPEEEAWDLFYNNLHLCKKNEWCYTLLEQMTLNTDIKVVFITGREERARKHTKAFLKFNHPIDWDLYMRPTGCLDEDAKVKRDIMNTIKDDYNWLFALDDRESNCSVFNDYGITTLKVTSL